MNPETFRTRAEGAGDLEKAMSILGTDKLRKLCEQVGITDVIELGPRATRRPAPNIGIVSQIYWAATPSFMPLFELDTFSSHETCVSTQAKISKRGC